MPHERFRQDDPREWINRAHSNLIQAKGVENPEIYLEDLCFQAEQATEKAIKAILLHRRIQFPYIHDLAELVNLLRKGGERIPPFVEEAVGLTDFAVQARYPGAAEDVSRDEYEETIELAERVLHWAEEIIGYAPERSA